MLIEGGVRQKCRARTCVAEAIRCAGAKAAKVMTAKKSQSLVLLRQMGVQKRTEMIIFGAVKRDFMRTENVISKELLSHLVMLEAEY